MTQIVSSAQRLSIVIAILVVSVCPGHAADIPQAFFDKHCIDCHDDLDTKAEIRLDNASQRNWNDHTTPDLFERVLKAIRTGQMPPKKRAGKVTDSERKAAIDSLHATLIEHSDKFPMPMRRLTRSEYTKSINSIFGIEFQTPPGFPTDNPIHGFNNTAEKLAMSSPLMEAYFQSAIAIADQIIPPARKPVQSTSRSAEPQDMVISYSSGAVVDGVMRLATRTNVVFRSCTWPAKVEVRTAGTYRIRVTASRFAPSTPAWPDYQDPMKMQIRIRSQKDLGGEAVTKLPLIQAFEVISDKPQVFECEATLQPFQIPIVYFANAPISGDRGDNSGPKGSLADTLRAAFKNDPRLLAGWLKVKHGRGLRGGTGWERVKKIRDSPDLDVASVDMSEKAIEKLIKTMTSDPRQYAESVVYQHFEEGPALSIHRIEIEGPIKVIKSDVRKKQEVIAQRFLGDRGDMSDEQFTRSFLDRFLTQAFRRPASESDIDRYVAIVNGHVSGGQTLDNGLHLAIRTALMSSKFLYRSREPDRFDDFDLAARLAYFLTGGPPDSILFDAAKSGKLADPAELMLHAKRLLKSSYRKQFVSDFTGQWLGLKHLEDIMPDPRLFPDFKSRHQAEMVQETELLFDEILKKNLPVASFIKPDFTYLTQSLAKTVYGRNDIKKTKGFVRVSIPPGSPYGGLLGQASVMMATANGVDTQPVERGVWVLENILGDPPPAPPESVPALTPDTTGAKTVRDQLAAHRAEASCAACHRRIDPVGYVLENFDPIGRWRTHYPEITQDSKGKPKVKNGHPIETQAEFPGGIEFNDIHDLKQYTLDNIHDFANCLARKLMTYATGHPVSYAEKQEIKAIVQSNLALDDGFQDLLFELIKSNTFRSR